MIIVDDVMYPEYNSVPHLMDSYLKELGFEMSDDGDPDCITWVKNEPTSLHRNQATQISLYKSAQTWYEDGIDGSASKMILSGPSVKIVHYVNTEWDPDWTRRYMLSDFLKMPIISSAEELYGRNRA